MKMKLLMLFSFFFTTFGLLFVVDFASAQEVRIPKDDKATCVQYGGVCESKVADCYPKNTRVVMGYCLDEPAANQQSLCCKNRTGATGVGTDNHCAIELKGNCVQKTQTCGKSAVKVGDCSPDAAGTQRICCQTLPGSQITGPMVAPYSLLEKIPGSSNTVGNLNTYLEDIYRFAFWAVGIAVVFMLTIGGFMYLTSAGNTSRLGTAKTIIFDAFLGLILALVAWLFLNLINPNLVDLALPTTTVVTPPPPPVTGGNASSLAAILKTTPGVSVNNTGSCSADIGGAITQVSPSLSLDQSANGEPVIACHKGCSAANLCSREAVLNEVMLRGLIDLANQVGPFTITSFTGGSHAQTSLHYSGNAVDIVPGAADKSVWLLMQSFLRTKGATKPICDIPNPAKPGESMNVNCDDPRATHIHAQW